MAIKLLFKENQQSILKISGTKIFLLHTLLHTDYNTYTTYKANTFTNITYYTSYSIWLILPLTIPNYNFIQILLTVHCTHYLQYNIFIWYIPSKWIVLFVHTDWLAQRWLAKCCSSPRSWIKTKWLFLVYCQDEVILLAVVIKLVWYILKQLCTSVLVNVVDIYLDAARLSKYPPLFTTTSVNNC